MLKNSKVVTSIVIMLIVFSALLLLSSGLSFNAINQDKHNFVRASVLTGQQGQLSDALQTLLKTALPSTVPPSESLRSRPIPLRWPGSPNCLVPPALRWTRLPFTFLTISRRLSRAAKTLS